jgi:small conductance mechanosensitive channel
MLNSIDVLAQTTPDPESVELAVPDGLTLADWLLAAAIVVAAFVLAGVVRRVLKRTLGRRSEASAALTSRVIVLLIVAVGCVYALSSIGVDVGLLVGALGIGGIALAFAFQDILENFVAGVILQLKRPFRPGNIVEAGEARHLGIIREIDSRSVILDMFSGERIVLPAAQVLKSPIINWTANPRRRLAVPIGIAYRTDPQDAIDAIEPHLEKIDEVLADPPPRVLLSELGESSVVLTAYVWHDAYGDIFWIQHRVVQEAKAALADAGIEIPFPQRVVTFAPDPGVNVIGVREANGRSSPTGQPAPRSGRG